MLKMIKIANKKKIICKVINVMRKNTLLKNFDYSFFKQSISILVNE
uniref:Uncharacterized protein n=1 Tax=Bartonella rochalimae ATCC BAA-1498 TaxID=685782 RepID=E6YKM1_9HYPH|nr:hypothetical protein BARRO_20066 [Bartonella rochalimae ATCC BAA-1498]